eukprot:TRINITY_DN50250_c0_g1_i1.p1 TRINITY_DN50250_c0_g1~~TRINITY_DN50250_c0_g1_i1.p1  ORF type:complete len:369 (-),score=57.36 TRINITY_DN50250_c0_g1_i1:86-1192(-)
MTLAMILYLLTLTLPAVGVKLASEKRHRIYYERDGAGFNNVRLQFETMVGIAAAFDRELVIPPPSNIYLLPEPFQETDVWNPEEMKHVIHFTLLSDQVPWPPSCFNIGQKGLEQIKPNELPQNQDWCFQAFQSRVRHFECMSMFTPEQQKLATTAVFNGLQFHGRFVDKAKTTLQQLKLKPGAFVATHIRKGDFASQTTAWSMDSVYPTLNEHARGQPLLIATDDKEMQVLNQVQQHVDASSIVSTEKVLGPSRFLLEGAITDMLVCAMAGTFIGTPGSTFSNSIDDQRQKIKICKASRFKRAPLAFTQVSEQLRTTRWFNPVRTDTYHKTQYAARAHCWHDIGDFDKITDFAAVDHLKQSVCQLDVQ